MTSEKRPRCRPIPLPTQYSLEFVRSDGPISRIYIDGKMRRIDDIEDNSTTIDIWRPDIEMSYRINTENKTYIGSPITRDMQEVASTDIEDDVEWEYVATEPLGPHTADVYDVFEKATQRRRARIHVDGETHIRLKTVTFNGLGNIALTIEAKNVVMGPPPASVFELPPGFREIRFE